jgi:tRNA A37 methylthiotransferase MiaB
MDTIRLLREVKPDVMNISRYWARPGTPAARMKQLPGGVVKERSRMLTDVSEEISLERNRKWIGWEGDVFVDDIGKNGMMIGRNFAYKQVLVRGVEKGQTVRVRIVDAGVYDLRGEII